MKSNNKSVEPVIDYLAVEIAREEATKTRKAGKHERVTKLLKNLANVPTPIAVLDFLGD